MHPMILLEFYHERHVDKETLMGGNTGNDYHLFITGKAIVAVESKREENPLGDEVKQ